MILSWAAQLWRGRGGGEECGKGGERGGRRRGGGWFMWWMSGVSATPLELTLHLAQPWPSPCIVGFSNFFIPQECTAESITTDLVDAIFAFLPGGDGFSQSGSASQETTQNLALKCFTKVVHLVHSTHLQQVWNTILWKGSFKRGWRILAIAGAWHCNQFGCKCDQNKFVKFTEFVMPWWQEKGTGLSSQLTPNPLFQRVGHTHRELQLPYSYRIVVWVLLRPPKVQSGGWRDEAYGLTS